MVESFKTDRNETIYAVTDAKTTEEILKQLAAFKKESFASVKKKFKHFETGYMIRNGKHIELWADKVRKGGTPCMIVRR